MVPKLLTGLVALVAAFASVNAPIANAQTSDKRLETCGRLVGYTEQTLDAKGSITIAGDSFVIASGPAATGENFPPSSLLTQMVCITASLSEAGEIVSHSIFGIGLTPLPTALCGNVTGYEAPGTGADGSIRLSGGPVTTSSGASFALDPSYDWPPSVPSFTCVRLGADESGRAIALSIDSSNPQPAAEPRQPAATPQTLPSTGTFVRRHETAVFGLVAITAAFMVVTLLALRQPRKR